MTAVEKAEDLVDKMEHPLEGVSIIRVAAKQLALIAVDELLLLITYQPTIDYWNEVKQEIEKL
jgi:hypothetical protein